MARPIVKLITAPTKKCGQSAKSTTTTITKQVKKS